MFNRTNDSLRQILVVVGLVVVLLVNFLADYIPINGITTGELSDSFDVYLVPAGYVFAVWGLIYLFQILFVIYKALPSQQDNALQRKIAPWYLLNCIGNTAWILVWHYKFIGTSLIIMVVILITLIAIYTILGTGRKSAPRGETWFMRVPFSLYFAWITVATVANATTWLYSIGWDGFGLDAVIWAVIILIVTTLIECVMILRYHDLAYTAVILWAFVGIVVKNSDTAVVAVTAALMTAVIAVTFFIATVRKPSKPR